MQWTQEAEDAVKKVPFFVRKKVRAHVEKEARLTGRDTVTLAVVQTARKKFLDNMSSEIKGYQVDACFGPGAAPTARRKVRICWPDLKNCCRRKISWVF